MLRLAGLLGDRHKLPCNCRKLCWLIAWCVHCPSTTSIILMAVDTLKLEQVNKTDHDCPARGHTVIVTLEQ